MQARAYRISFEIKMPYAGEAGILILEQNICDMEIEIVAFVINWRFRSTEVMNVITRSVAFCCVIDLMFNGIHLAQVILKLRAVYGQNIVDVPVCEIKPKMKTVSFQLRANSI